MFILIRVKYLLCLLCLNKSLIFSATFQRMPQNQISWISVRWKPTCCPRQTDIQKYGI